MTFPATLALISNVFTERRERARAIGLWGAISGVAIATGPIVGGWLLEHYSWAAIFIAMAPVAAAAVVFVALAVPASKDPGAAAVDIPGLVLSSATMALLVFTIIEAPTYGWAAGRSVAGFAASAVLLAAFIMWERRGAHPMLDVRLFRNMRFSAASGAVTVSFFTLFGFIFLITQYFQFVRGYGPLSTGVRLLPVAVSVGAGSVAGTQLAVRAGTKLVVTTGLVASAASTPRSTRPGSPAPCPRPCQPRSRRSRTSPSAPRTWPPARSRPSAIRPWDWRCITPPPTRSCAASSSAPSSPAASPRWGPSWRSFSCPLSQRPQWPTKPNRPNGRTIARPIPIRPQRPLARVPRLKARYLDRGLRAVSLTSRVTQRELE